MGLQKSSEALQNSEFEAGSSGSIGKWPVYCATLSRAIRKLPQIADDVGLQYNEVETIYHGLANVRFAELCQFVNPDDFSCSFSIPTFVSCSTNPVVSRTFALHAGLSGHAAAGTTTDALLFKIQITKNQVPVAADVSWISKFPQEKEIIVAPYQVFKLATVKNDITYGVPAAKKSDGTMVKDIEEAVAAIEASVTRTRHGSVTFTEVPCRIAPSRGVCANRRRSVIPTPATAPVQVPVPAPAHRDAPPPSTSGAHIYLSENHRAALLERGAGAATLHLPGWVPQVMVSQSFFGDRGEEYVLKYFGAPQKPAREPPQKHDGNAYTSMTLWAPEFSNVHSHLPSIEPEIEIDDEKFSGAEAYFQVMKSYGEPDHQDAKRAMRNCRDPMEAWQIGRTHSLRADWETVKYSVMETALRATCGYDLVQIKPSDSYWGTGETCQGYNFLGKLLMNLRQEYFGDEC